MTKAVHPLWHQHSLMAPKIPTLEWQQLICMGNVPELTLEPLLLPRKLQEFCVSFGSQPKADMA